MRRGQFIRTRATAAWRTTALGILTWLGTSAPAWAHHVMDGETPRSTAAGLLSGLAHPVIGPDHLLFVLSVGLLSALTSLRRSGPVLFALGTAAGCAARVHGLEFEGHGLPVALSLVATGAALLARGAPPLAPLAAGLLVAGAFHGHAYGEAIAGAEPAPLGAYLIGFLAVQIAIARAAGELFLRGLTRRPAGARGFRLALGAGCALLGTVLLWLGAPSASAAEPTLAATRPAATRDGADAAERDADTPPESVEELVITATRTQTHVDRAPASASVITRDELESFTFDGIDDALRYEVGFYEGRLRGLSSSNQTLAMINGMPINSGWWGGVEWQNIAVENISRIEIVRGPTSALYGGSAMGGAVNVITALPSEFEMSLRSRLGSDDRRSYGGSIGHRLSERFAVRAGFEIEPELEGRVTDYTWRPLSSGAPPVGADPLQGGEPAIDRNARDRWIVGDQGERRESQWNVHLSSQLELSESASLRLDAQLGQSEGRNKAPHTYLRSAGAAAYAGALAVDADRFVQVRPGDFLRGPEFDRDGAYMITYSDVLLGAEIVGKLGFRDEKSWYTTPTPGDGQGYANAPGELREFRTQGGFADWQIHFPLAEGQRITAGVYGRVTDFDQADFDLAHYRDAGDKTSGETEITQGQDRSFAQFVQAELQLVPESLTAYLGARYDLWEAVNGRSGAVGRQPDGSVLRAARAEDARGSAISPSAALVWQAAEDTVLRVSAARAFRAPTLYDRYRSYAASPSFLVEANPDLEPERLWNFEIGGVQYFWDRRVRLSGSVYQSNVEDLIFSYRESGPNPAGDLVTYSRRDNAGRARIRGLELSTEIAPWEGLRLWGGYTRTRAEIREHARNPEFEGRLTTFVPESMIHGGIELRRGWARAALSGRYVGRLHRSASNDDLADVFQSNSEVWLWELRLAADLPFDFARLERAHLSLSIRNLFDEEYFDYSIGRGRTVYAELRTRW